MKQENNVDGIVKNILKRRIIEADVEKLTKEEMKKVILSIMERQNVFRTQYEIYEKHKENEKISTIIEEVEEIIEMLQTDRELKGEYELSSSTKEYSKNVEKDIQEIINRHKPDIKTKFNDEELATLRHWYESPNNEYKNLSFEEYIKSACEAGVIEELLYD